MASAPLSAQVGDADPISAGADLLQTLPGTFFAIGGLSVPLHGVPDSMGADTIIQRLAAISIPDVLGATQTINTQMTELNLASNAGAGPGGTTVLINLTPGVPTLGTLLLTQTINGEGIPEGTFSSFFDVFFDLHLTAGSIPVPCDANADLVCHMELTLTGTGTWTDDVPGRFLVNPVTEIHPGAGVHIAQQISPSPEPDTLVLSGTGMVLTALSPNRQLAANADRLAASAHHRLRLPLVSAATLVERDIDAPRQSSSLTCAAKLSVLSLMGSPKRFDQSVI